MHVYGGGGGGKYCNNSTYTTHEKKNKNNYILSNWVVLWLRQNQLIAQAALFLYAFCIQVKLW